MSYFADPLKLVPHQRTLLLFCVTYVWLVFSSRINIKLSAVTNAILQNDNCFIGAAIEHGFLLYMPTVHCNEFE